MLQVQLNTLLVPLYTVSTIVYCHNYCIRPTVLYSESTTVYCQYHCILSLPQHTTSNTVRPASTTVYCQYHSVPPLSQRIANGTACCQYCSLLSVAKRLIPAVPRSPWFVGGRTPKPNLYGQSPLQHCTLGYLFCS